MKFNPVPSKDDFTEIANKDYFNLMIEQKNKKFKSEITEEIEKLLWCDYLIIVFPFWWSGMPAIMKGWFEKVFACGTAWDFGKAFDEGLLKGKFGLVVSSVGSPQAVYSVDSLQKSSVKRRMFYLTWGTLKFCGMQPLEPCFFHGASGTEDQRKVELDELSRTVADLHNIPYMKTTDISK